MPISYSLVAYHTRVLSEASNNVGGNEGEIARQILLTIPQNSSLKKSYGYQGQIFHYMSAADGLVVLCMADAQTGNRVAFSFLQDVQNRFRGRYSVFANSPEQGMQDFARTLSERMEFFSNNPSSEKISKVKHEIEEVKVTLRENIDKVLDRGDKIEVIMDKTDLLQAQSGNFRKVSTAVKRKMWWQNKKCWCISIIICCIVIAGCVAGALIGAGVFAKSST